MDEKFIAYHEAGHAIQFNIEGCKITEISLDNSNTAKNKGGVKPCRESSKHLNNIQHIRILLAGLIAELVLSNEEVPSSYEDLVDFVDEDIEQRLGWRGDWNKARNYAFKEAGYQESLCSDVGEPPTFEHFDHARNIIYNEFVVVIEFIKSHWKSVELIANHIHQQSWHDDKKTLSGEKFLEILQIHKQLA